MSSTMVGGRLGLLALCRVIKVFWKSSTRPRTCDAIEGSEDAWVEGGGDMRSLEGHIFWRLDADLDS
jgi:hypothetical protein